MSDSLDLAQYLPYLLNRAGSRVAAAFSRVVRDWGITLPMWRALAALNQRDGQSVSELSDTTSIEISTLSRVLDSMQAKELIERRRAPADARRVTVHLTDAGHAMTRQIIPVARHYEEVALADFTASEAAALKAMLPRLYDNIQRLEEEAERRAAG